MNADDRCPSECTFRNDEHVTHRCELTAGHPGEHREGDAEWTDETTWYP